MPLLIVRNDITKIKADAIVNTANTRLLEGSGTSRAIYLAAGEKKLTKACEKIGYCPLGGAVITDAFDLPAKYIIHAVGPKWIDGNADEITMLYSAYIESMKIASSKKLESIAFPLIASGNSEFPKEKALKAAINAISDYLMEHELLVYLVIYDRDSLTVSQKLFNSVEQYIDDHYVSESDESYSRNSRNRYNENTVEASIHLEGQSIFSRTNLSNPMVSVPMTSAPKMSISKMSTPKMSSPAASTHMQSAPKSLDKVFENANETFSQMLLRLIDERGLKDSEVYNKANIDRRLFSKIRNDIEYTPSKRTVLSFAIALNLSLDETKDLLMKAGLALSNCNEGDLIVSYFIELEFYDIVEINLILFKYNQPILG